MEGLGRLYRAPAKPSDDDALAAALVAEWGYHVENAPADVWRQAKTAVRTVRAKGWRPAA